MCLSLFFLPQDEATGSILRNKRTGKYQNDVTSVLAFD